MINELSRRRVLAGLAASATMAGIAGRASAGILDSLGVRKLLGNASDSALGKLGQADGFYRDVAVRILLPGAKGKFASKLMRTGDKLGLTKNLTKSLNDAASLAANEAKPIFRGAIEQLKLSDVPGLALKKDGATQFLMKTASPDLLVKIRPLISAALGKVGAFQQLAQLNKSGSLLAPLGLTEAKITDSVSDQALKGIFSYMGNEEAALKANPLKL